MREVVGEDAGMSNFTTVEDVFDLVTDGTHYTPNNVG
jgi:hypothetical protein